MRSSCREQCWRSTHTWWCRRAQYRGNGPAGPRDFEVCEACRPFFKVGLGQGVGCVKLDCLVVGRKERKKIPQSEIGSRVTCAGAVCPMRSETFFTPFSKLQLISSRSDFIGVVYRTVEPLQVKASHR